MVVVSRSRAGLGVGGMEWAGVERGWERVGWGGQE